MRTTIYGLAISIWLGLIGIQAPAQVPETKFDTTVKTGKVGYRVFCKNKPGDDNLLSIKLVGFLNTAKDMSFLIRGHVVQAVIDDLNNDGYPDLVLYIFSGLEGEFGTVYAFASDQNKAIIPIALPEVVSDGKLSAGYKGHDEFSLMEGSLLQKFPVYKPGDDKNHPTGGKRIIQYQIVPAGKGTGYKFKVLQSYDMK
jgi:hypothetical protein